MSATRWFCSSCCCCSRRRSSPSRSGTISIPISALWDALARHGRLDAGCRRADAAACRASRWPSLVGAGLGMSRRRAAGHAAQSARRAVPARRVGRRGGRRGARDARSGLAPRSLPLAAFAGAIVAVAAAFLVARAAGGRGDPRMLLMAGVVVGAFANAAIMVVLANAQPNTVRNALWWMMGSVERRDVVAGRRAVRVRRSSAAARCSSLGRADRRARARRGGRRGARARTSMRAMRRVFLVASLLAAATVAAAGLVGFVGLVVPHIVRVAGVRRTGSLLVGSALAGATLVVLADRARPNASAAGRVAARRRDGAHRRAVLSRASCGGSHDRVSSTSRCAIPAASARRAGAACRSTPRAARSRRSSARTGAARARSCAR